MRRIFPERDDRHCPLCIVAAAPVRGEGGDGEKRRNEGGGGGG